MKVDIDDRLYKKIKEWIKEEEHQFEYSNIKQFVTASCYYMLKLQQKKERLRS